MEGMESVGSATIGAKRETGRAWDVLERKNEGRGEEGPGRGCYI